MGDTITPMRVFISSPGDLVPERAVVRAVLDQLNRSPAFRDRFKFIAYAWEQDVPALMGRAAQEVVDTYLLDPADADILVCKVDPLSSTMTQPIFSVGASSHPYEMLDTRAEGTVGAQSPRPCRKIG